MMKFVEFPGPRGTLRGALHLPDRPVAARSPGVVICHGLTGQRMEPGFLFVALSRALERAGLASLRFDFYGSGESDGQFRDMTISAELADAPVALDFFKSQPEIDPARVGLMGLSMGGLVTACTLGRRPDVRAAALWSAAAKMYARHSAKLTPEQRHTLDTQGWIDRAGLQIGKGFYDDLIRHDPCADIARFRGPVLVIHGAADAVVPLDEAQGYLDSLARRPAAVTDHLFVDGADHTFNNVLHRQAVIDRTVAWFGAQL